MRIRKETKVLGYFWQPLGIAAANLIRISAIGSEVLSEELACPRHILAEPKI